MTGHKVEFYSGSFEVDGTHMGYLAVRLWRTPTVKIWVQAAFPTARTREGVHGRTFRINGGGPLGP